MTDEIKKTLIVVRTRGGYEAGSDHDEFVQEWGGGRNEPFKWYPLSNNELLLLHGCTPLDDIITKLKGTSDYSKLTDYDRIHLYSHGNFPEAFFAALGLKNDHEVRKYSGGGNKPAVEGLFDEMNSLGMQEVSKEIVKLTQGPKVLDSNLRRVQDGLLQIWLDIGVVLAKKTPFSAEAEKHAADIAVSIRDMFGPGRSLSMALARWRKLKRPKIAESASRIAALSGSDLVPDELKCKSYWNDYSRQETYSNTSLVLADLGADFLTMARAIEVLRHEGIAALGGEKG